MFPIIDKAEINKHLHLYLYTNVNISMKIYKLIFIKPINELTNTHKVLRRVPGT